jgi:plasmid stabilization system protein ParE
MPTFEDSTADAAEAQLALRALAHATRSITDPADLYSVLGSLSGALRSLEQSLHQLAATHDGTDTPSAVVNRSRREGRAAGYQVAWELHRAGEMVRQVGRALDHAHEVEATIGYDFGALQGLPEPARPGADRGLGL